MVYKCFGKKSSGGAATLANKYAIKIKNISSKELAEELQKLYIHTKHLGCRFSRYALDK